MAKRLKTHINSKFFCGNFVIKFLKIYLINGHFDRSLVAFFKGTPKWKNAKINENMEKKLHNTCIKNGQLLLHLSGRKHCFILLNWRKSYQQICFVMDEITKKINNLTLIESLTIINNKSQIIFANSKVTHSYEWHFIQNI